MSVWTRGRWVQFEREVISERVRDKVAASKAKGIWMGGPVPLGYRVEARKLLIKEDEAATVRSIMQRYLEVGSVPALLKELGRSRIVTKVQALRDGRTRGGLPFTRGSLHHLLKNRIYVGEIGHKGSWYPGEHHAVVTSKLFELVQQKLAAAAGDQYRSPRSTHACLLTGMFKDGQGRVMSPRHTKKADRRYRYYVSGYAAPDYAGKINTADSLHLSAGDLERVVRDGVVTVLRDGLSVTVAAGQLEVSDSQRLIEHCRKRANELVGGTTIEARKLLISFKTLVVVEGDSVRITLDVGSMLSSAHVRPPAIMPFPLGISIPLQRVRYGNETRLRVDPSSAEEKAHGRKLADIVIKAHAARDTLLRVSESDPMPLSTMRHLQQVARLAYLAPDITVAILDGTAPIRRTSRDLVRVASLPLGWDEQREMFGVA